MIIESDNFIQDVNFVKENIFSDLALPVLDLKN
jgi:hypothetical protein